MTNLDFQNHILDLLEGGCTVLAETERFVHQIQRKFRLRRLASGAGAWDSPSITTLNRWLDSFWSQTWPDEWPASSFERWRVLKECIEYVVPPEPVSADIGLIHLLDESFESLLRYGMDPGSGEAANRLIEWRREIWRLFSVELEGSGLFHPARLPRKILRSLERGGHLPSKMVFVGFEFAGDTEKLLLSAIEDAAEAVFLSLPIGTTQPEALTFSDPDQEITGLMENLLASTSRLAPHEIAVVVLDSGFYSPAVSTGLEDLLGEPLSVDQAAYNLSPDTYLAASPLFCAALLPLRFAVDGQRREDFFAFLRSPHYGYFSRWSRKLAQWDIEWRTERIDSGLDGLLRAVRIKAAEIFPEKGEEIGAVLMPFLGKSQKTASLWADDLRRIWDRLQFPVIANELDRISWQNLDDLLSRFEKEFAQTQIGSSEFSELLASAASRIRVQKTGAEDAGIQVLGRLDARGLTFSKVFIPGLVSGALPQPARSLPLLGAGERKRVLGATAESQLAFARYIFANLCASAPDITLSRPAMSRDGELCLPSPFWPHERERRIAPVIAWKDPLPAMQRAAWVQQSISGFLPGQSATTAPCALDFRMAPLSFSDPISVSALQAALLCPARFVFRHILRLEELASIESGITALERGQRVHEILAAFVLRAGPAVRAGGVGFEELAELLEKIVVEKLAPDLPGAAWEVELERLTGRNDFPGLLLKWLEEEWKQIQEGWSWLVAESGFTDMDLPGAPARLKGRLDRIDCHPDKGLICWDYKTGSIPSKKEIREDNVQPQLPAYLLAVKKGLIRGPEKGSGCGAGYIDLSAPGNIKHLLHFDPAEDNDTFLSEWQKEVAAVLNLIASGDISPLWLKENDTCEERCAYREICCAP